MSRLKDLTGQRFGRLTVLQREGQSKNGNAKWLCKCDCGNLRVVDGYGLRTGQTVSCGCYRREQARKNILNKPVLTQNIGNWHILEKTWHPTSEDLRANNRSGITGVSYDRNQKRWVARLFFHGRYVLNTMYDRKESAIQARKDAEERYLKVK
ncbi:alcohol dehydrogenase [Secundilactobacillus pentosiphilus]|nr:alcohol dehydrogenase [Secundilactobacillus pentosiphilus]